MKKMILISILIFSFSICWCTVLLAASLDGTEWKHDYDDGSSHYMAFYNHYMYVASSDNGDEPYNWSRDTFPYFSRASSDGSIYYISFILTTNAWVIMWGTCNINEGQAWYDAFGMALFIFPLHNGKSGPYSLVSDSWVP